MTDTPAILDKLRELLQAQLKLSDADAARIDLSTTPVTVPGWTSMAHLELMLAVERAYDLTFDADDIAGLASVQSIVDAVSRNRA